MTIKELKKRDDRGIVYKTARQMRDRKSLRKTIEAFLVQDMPIIRKQLKKSNRALNKNLSRRISSK